MKISKAITEIFKQKEHTQMLIDDTVRNDHNNRVKISRLIGKREGLELALEIIKENM
ncbi:hypothetical protein [Clostridium brassicae]|uniref:Uncharacterized protein n=1 Tax=Clostridium brassicae TaxID=2999072 RepID=A0ABT4D6D7_9CLOT|nr:hypothetical protein [Clostridium brassicae]MCY6957866.1 hypothetical protein [Clostridium brassicae]